MKRDVLAARGFTLLELLLALSLFSLLSLMAYGGLEQLITQRERMNEKNHQLEELQLVIQQLENDIRSYRPGSVVSGGELQLSESGASWVYKPLSLQGPARLARVAWQLRDEALVRLQWPDANNIDHRSVPIEKVMLKGVSGFSFERFINGRWSRRQAVEEMQAEGLSFRFSSHYGDYHRRFVLAESMDMP